MSNYMALTSDVIVMPKMEVGQMVRRRGRHINIATVRRLLGWAHAKFINRLALKCHDVANDPRYPFKSQPTALLVQPEPNTSKTCSQCGQLR